MLISKGVFTFVNKKVGVNQDGEKYFAIDVISKGVNKNKLSFLTKDEKLINKLYDYKFTDFQDISITVDFSRLYNSNRYPYWSPVLVGVGNIGINE